MTGSSGEINPSEAETRIQEETPRLKTQYNRKVGAERAIFNAFDAYPVLIQFGGNPRCYRGFNFPRIYQETQK